MKKPINRSKARLLAGIIFYTVKKQLYWHNPKNNFAQLQTKKLPLEIISHQTILRRQLKDIDMWMQENKITNLKLAIQKLNGLTLEPGQTFSYWREIGQPTKKKGFLPGMILRDGQVLTGVGGGLCQLSNLIYWLTIHTPLTVVERWRHTYDVFPDSKRNQPFGSGATCAYPAIDLQIKNNTLQSFQLSLELTEENLIGRWLSDAPLEFEYRIVEKDHEIKNEWWGAYIRSNKIFRKIIDKQTSKEVGEDFITANQAIMMYNPLLEYKEK